MKKSVLEDDALLFNREEGETDREKMKSMTLRQKLRFLKDYYLVGALAVIAIAVFAVYSVWQVVKPREPVLLSIAVVNDLLDDEKKQSFTGELQEHLAEQARRQQAEDTGNGQSGKEDAAGGTVTIDDNFVPESGGLNKLQIFTLSGQLDLIFCSQEQFKSLAANGFFADMTEILTGEELEEWKDLLVYTEGQAPEEEEIQEEEETPEAGKAGQIAPFGLNMASSAKLGDLLNGITDPVSGVVISSQNTQNAIEGIRYLLE